MKQTANNGGYITAIVLLIFFGIFTIGISLASRSSLLLKMEENTKRKIQSFYASDGQMTLLSQELIDGNSKKYRSVNFVVYDDFMRPANEKLDSGWVESEPDIQNKVDLLAERVVFTSNGEKQYRPMIKKTFPQQTSDTLVWQFLMQWQCNDPQYDSFALFFQLGGEMTDDDLYDNVGVSLLWGDKKSGGYSQSQMLGYCKTSNNYEMRETRTATNIKVIVNMNTKQYNVQIDEVEYAKNIPFYSSTLNSISQMRIFVENLNTAKFCGCCVDNITLLKKAVSSYSATDEKNYGDFNVAWDVIEEQAGVYGIATKSFVKDAPTLNKYRTPLYQKITNPVTTNVEYPSTVRIPVRFYDFHSDRRNPEFEQPIVGGNDAYKGMVALKLDKEGKPQLSTNSENYVLNYYIKYWFRLTDPTNMTSLQMYSTTCAVGDFSVTDNLASTVDIQIPNGAEFRTVSYAFENMVIDSALVFTHLGAGVYQFTSSSFFPLDNRGFGNENNKAYYTIWWPSPHNYSFTMEMMHSFIKIPNQFFKFKGDDDVWIFVNDSLILDIGGKHAAVADSFLVDALPNLENNTAYNMKFFFCERHTVASTITITTNMAFSNPFNTKSRLWGRDYGNIF